MHIYIYNCYVNTIHKGIIVQITVVIFLHVKNWILTIHYILIPLNLLGHKKFNGLDVGWMLTGQNAAAGEDSRISPFFLVLKEV